MCDINPAQAGWRKPLDVAGFNQLFVLLHYSRSKKAAFLCN